MRQTIKIECTVCSDEFPCFIFAANNIILHCFFPFTKSVNYSHINSSLLSIKLNKHCLSALGRDTKQFNTRVSYREGFLMNIN